MKTITSVISSLIVGIATVCHAQSPTNTSLQFEFAPYVWNIDEVRPEWQHVYQPKQVALWHKPEPFTETLCLSLPIFSQTDIIATKIVTSEVGSPSTQITINDHIADKLNRATQHPAERGLHVVMHDKNFRHAYVLSRVFEPLGKVFEMDWVDPNLFKENQDLQFSLATFHTEHDCQERILQFNSLKNTADTLTIFLDQDFAISQDDVSDLQIVSFMNNYSGYDIYGIIATVKPNAINKIAVLKQDWQTALITHGSQTVWQGFLQPFIEHQQNFATNQIVIAVSYDKSQLEALLKISTTKPT